VRDWHLLYDLEEANRELLLFAWTAFRCVLTLRSMKVYRKLVQW
jgi:hypothetical protein